MRLIYGSTSTQRKGVYGQHHVRADPPCVRLQNMVTLRLGDAAARAVIGPLTEPPTQNQNRFTTASKRLRGRCVDVEPTEPLQWTGIRYATRESGYRMSPWTVVSAPALRRRPASASTRACVDLKLTKLPLLRCAVMRLPRGHRMLRYASYAQCSPAARCYYCAGSGQWSP